MPPLVRRYIKTSFVFLLAGLGLGGYIAVVQFVVGYRPPPPRLAEPTARARAPLRVGSPGAPAGEL